jgi:hypothetical protein
VSGSRDPGQEIQLLSPTGGDPLCIIPADGSGSWSCTVGFLPDGPAVALRAVVTGNAGLAAEVSVRVLHAPTVTGGATGQDSTSGVVRGTAYPGATVTATLGSGQQCSFTADSSGAWSCLIQGDLVSGPDQVTASQQTSFSRPASSAASVPVSILIDVDAPAAPTIAGPTAGTNLSPNGAAYFGTGEDGATVTVFAGAYSVCSAVVTGGTWSCSAAGVADGSYDLRAVQQDPAGNVSPGSPAFSVTYGTSVPTPTPTPTPTGTPTPTPTPTATPAPETAAPTPAPTETAAPAPSPSASGSPSASPEPTLPGDENTAEAVPPELIVPGGWNDPTQFSTAVIPPWSVAQFPWLQAVLLALGAVLLVVVPARLLAGTVSRARDGRPLWAGHKLAGRNHADTEFEVPPQLRLNRWVAGAGSLVAAAVFVMLSGPVTGQPAYLRLMLAVTIALLVVNAVATLVPQWWGARALHVQVTVTFLPRYLLLVAVAALASRALDLHPALLFGLLGSVVIGAGPLGAQRGQLAAVRAGSLIALALVGLLVVGTLPTASGFVGVLAVEVANTIVLTAIGSAALVLIPVGNTSGRSILAWSPPIWAALTVLAYLVFFTVVPPMTGDWRTDGSAVVLTLLAVGFAAVSVTIWAWQRFVGPSLR